MTREEHADRVARNTLELVQARRQLAAVHEATRLGHLSAQDAVTVLTDLLADLDAALGPQPAPTSGDPA